MVLFKNELISGKLFSFLLANQIFILKKVLMRRGEPKLIVPKYFCNSINLLLPSSVDVTFSGRNKEIILGRCCGSVGRAVVSNTRDPLCYHVLVIGKN